ncbi:MAG: hypothetical protein JWM89_295 [Acidimicrobiales bacterium]|nr:hypothetical protein [Acidimicrobiales bacterium]
MALQGDLSSFALPDVLRLLAGTAKSGCLEISAAATTGEVWLRDGGVVGGAISTSPHALSPADVVFELLRLPEGSFVFDEGEEIDDVDVTSVEDTLNAAEALVSDWIDVESVVPSMDAWITFAPDIDDEITVSTDQWRALAILGNGGSVRDLADSMELTDLTASRLVKGLVEGGMALLRADDGYADGTELDDRPFATDAYSPADEIDDHDDHDDHDDLDVLRADDRPVMLESNDDALLPEPLPGEGVSYGVEGMVTGHVDGRGFDAVDHESPYEHLAPEAGYAAGAPEATDPWAALDDDTDAEEHPGDAEFHDVPRHDFHGQTQSRPVADSLQPEAPAAVPEPAAADPEVGDDDRGSLLKFLSSVQP